MTAAVIAVGDSEGDILISAAELGSGRVVVMTHGDYLTDFVAGNNSDSNIKKLQSNIKIWITKGKFTGS